MSQPPKRQPTGQSATLIHFFILGNTKRPPRTVQAWTARVPCIGEYVFIESRGYSVHDVAHYATLDRPSNDGPLARVELKMDRDNEDAAP